MISTSGEINFNIIFDGESGVTPDSGGGGNPAAPTNIGQPNESRASRRSMRRYRTSAWLRGIITLKSGHKV